MPQPSLAPLEIALIDALPDDPVRTASAARKLSHAFTSERSELPAHYLTDPDVLSAYLAAFLLPNAEKVLHCLAEADMLGALPAAGPIDVLDLGSGPGTASLAASLFFAEARPLQAVRFVTIEQELAAARACKRLFATIAPAHHALESIVTEISPDRFPETIGDRRFDLVVAANFLNELAGDDASFSLCRELLASHLKTDGALLIIDPALRETTRPLMALRDQLLAEDAATAVAPCLHQAHCPMLAANARDCPPREPRHEDHALARRGGRDWCHFYLDWECPTLVRRMDAISGMRHKHLKMAYLLLAPARHASRATKITFSRGEADGRVVSSPLDSKGKRECVLCGADGSLRRVRRMNRDMSDANRDFDEVVRGDIVRCESPARIGKEDAFRFVRRWRP